LLSLNLALTDRMDASKAIKEASEIKISICEQNYSHGFVTIDSWIINT